MGAGTARSERSCRCQERPDFPPAFQAGEVPARLRSQGGADLPWAGTPVPRWGKEADDCILNVYTSQGDALGWRDFQHALTRSARMPILIACIGRRHYPWA